MACASSESAGEGPVGVHVGAQNVRKNQGVAGVGLLAADAVPVAVTGGGQRVDREDPAAASAQARDQEAVAGLDGHRYRIVWAVAVLSHEVQELVVAGRVVGDTGFGEQSAGVVDEGDVVVALCPVDTAEHGQVVLPGPSVYAGHEHMRVTRRPNPRTRWSAISVAVRDTSALQGLDLSAELAGSRLNKRLTLERARAVTVNVRAAPGSFAVTTEAPGCAALDRGLKGPGKRRHQPGARVITANPAGDSNAAL